MQRMSDAERIDVGELRQDFSRYVEMARAGQRVEVTEEGKPTVYLVPADKARSVFDQLVAAGKVQRATRKGIADLLPIPPAPPGERSLSETLQEMRDEERY